MNEKKKYSVKELANILGCSITAVNKKIIQDNLNPQIKRYRNRYDVIADEGKTVILLTDVELEQEKRLSKGFKNVQSNVVQTPENVIDVDYTTDMQQNGENLTDKLLTFTNVYFERYETLQTRYINLLNEKSNEIKLLTDSESETQRNYLLISADNKTLEGQNENLKRSNTTMKRWLIVLITFLVINILVVITLITYYITYNNVHNSPKNPINNSLEKVQE